MIKGSISYRQGLKDKGVSHSHDGEAARKRGESQRGRAHARKEWEEANPGRVEEEKKRFVQEIQPLLQVFTITRIMKVCHCSPSYASLMKKGKYVPRPAFYKDLEKMTIHKVR